MNIQQSEQVLNGRDTAEKIIDVVANYYGLESDLVKSKTRKKEIVIARFTAIVLISDNTMLSLNEIGNLFSGRDHSTVIHAKKTFSDWHDTEPQIKEQYRGLKALLFEPEPIDEETLIINAS